MSVAAVMMCKDESDIIEHTLLHLLGQVDTIIVSDNASTDGTREILDRLASNRVIVLDDPEVAYQQNVKTTALAHRAGELGHDWVVPCDADEFWLTESGGRIGDVLDEVDPEFLFARAPLYDHKVTAGDDMDEPNPFKRMRWRFREPVPLMKVACRCIVPNLQIGMGNHEATINPTLGTPISSTGSPPSLDGVLVVEHYSWRSPEQLMRKIRNGYLAYEAAGEEYEQYGDHWRAFGHPQGERFAERVTSWFDTWAYSNDPWNDPAIEWS